MPYRTYWLIDKRVIVGETYGILTVGELVEYINVIRAEVETGDAPVHYIAEGSGVEKTQATLADLQKLIRTLGKIPKLGWLATVNENRIDRMMASITGQFFGGRTRSFGKIDEAIRFVLSVDEGLQKQYDPESLMARVRSQPHLK